ncbi:MAG TPA: glycosyltransferase [Chloroflexota bacterium]|nr:glycosyltransferase [Chloroflexota bacterium]
MSVARQLAGGQERAGAEPGKHNENRFLYIGSSRPLDRRLVEAAGLPFEAIDVGGLRGMGARALLNATKLPAGLATVVRLVRRFDPHVVLVSGGYVAAPVVAAAALLRIPLVVLTVEIDQGWVNMAAARLAQAVTASFPPALAHLPPDRTVLTGYPVREEFLHMDRARARATLELDPGLPVLAVFGGSLGSHRINEALAGSLPDLLLAAQVLHVCGEADQASLRERQAALPPTLRPRYRLFDYLPAGAMAEMMAAADLAICRAGAAPLAELPLAGVPAIMVPGPFSSQTTNAAYLREQGAAVVIDDDDLTSDVLHQQALSLLHDAQRTAEMAEKMRALARPDAAEAIASVVRRIAGVGRL